MECVAIAYKLLSLSDLPGIMIQVAETPTHRVLVSVSAVMCTRILVSVSQPLRHSDLIIIYMLMTPSSSYPSRQPSSVITFPVCRLVLAPSQT